MSAVVIDFATRELIRIETDRSRGIRAVGVGSGPVGDLHAARALLQPRSKVGALFGLTGRDLDRAVTRIETGVRFMPATEFFKRLMDLVISILGLIPIALVLPIIALIIRLDSRGPIFFRQTRVGLNGEEFDILKFRTMRVDADEQLARLLVEDGGSGPLFKLKDDPRVTRVGRFLRKYSLDELPQFWNVLRGQMSVVGPRPPLPQEVKYYDGPVYRRLHVKPGITGLWQVNGRSDLSWDESVRLDLYYVENWTVWVDLAIIGRTLRVMASPGPY